ncbi:hypothetical protein HDU80_004949, partial [Chytriomyces hyalinus]
INQFQPGSDSSGNVLKSGGSGSGIQSNGNGNKGKSAVGGSVSRSVSKTDVSGSIGGGSYGSGKGSGSVGAASSWSRSESELGKGRSEVNESTSSSGTGSGVITSGVRKPDGSQFGGSGRIGSGSSSKEKVVREQEPVLKLAKPAASSNGSKEVDSTKSSNKELVKRKSQVATGQVSKKRKVLKVPTEEETGKILHLEVWLELLKRELLWKMMKRT